MSLLSLRGRPSLPIDQDSEHLLLRPIPFARSELDVSEQAPITTEKPLGKPAKKPIVEKLDLLIVVISILASILGFLTINPRFEFAARLQTVSQITVLGSLLSIMNQCLQRVLPYLCVVLEARFGQSTLQNYDGLLRWSAFSRQLAWYWRTLIFTAIVLPIGLSVMYKQYTGGVGILSDDTLSCLFLPTGMLISSDTSIDQLI